MAVRGRRQITQAAIGGTVTQQPFEGFGEGVDDQCVGAGLVEDLAVGEEEPGQHMQVFVRGRTQRAQRAGKAFRGRPGWASAGSIACE